MTIDVWRLGLDSDKDMGLLPHSLDYFNRHFIGKPMAKNWKAPPIVIDGKSKRLRDFVSWMSGAGVVSEAAKRALEPLISPYVEILPLTELRGKPFFAINVTCIIDCMDRKKSVERGGKNVFGEVHFLPSRLKEIPIFKLTTPRF